MRPVRALGLVTLGGFLGFLVAAAAAKRALPSRGDEESDELALVAILDGIQLKNRSQAFRGGTMLAWFGGIAVDLREAKLADEAHLSVHTLFGGVAIRVPPDWRVESSLRAFAGGVDAASREAGDAAATLTLDGRALFGGISVGARGADAAFAD